MKKSEKAKVIMNLVRLSLDRATTEFVKESANLSATVAGSKQWEEEKKKEDWGGGFGPSNPYETGKAFERKNQTFVRMEEWKELHKFAEDTFLDMIYDENNV